MMNAREALVKRLEDVCYTKIAITVGMRTNPDMGIGINMDVVLEDVSDDENMIYLEIENGTFSVDATNVEYDETIDCYECYGNDGNVVFEFIF